MAAVVLQMLGFFCHEARNGFLELRVGNPVLAPGGYRFKSALDLVFALRARIEALVAMLDAVVDALVVAGFKMQELALFAATPIAPIQRIRALEEQGTGNTLLVLRGKHQQQLLG